MGQCSCVYLHGFLSSGNSLKGQWFKQAFAGQKSSSSSSIHCRVLTPTYPMQDPQESMRFLHQFIKQTGLLNSESKWFLAGSSMGGFYARYLAHYYRVPLLMINPALDPIALMSNYYGVHYNPHTREELFIDQIYRDKLAEFYPQTATKPLDSLLLLDKGDGVIPYQSTLKHYEKDDRQQCQIFEGGDHAFQHLEEAKPKIELFLRDTLFKSDQL
ncbi:MAG: YqiA/YcfP family alpha/beta fold hydrolase [Thiomicrorhabdus chilensis]|uniref:YqiA/YcfP family alpha/beta fold hydrolase n=1 Tax=Thiomicrorhabdus chilensis TaxID=63656 RepID=UPI00299D833D|nr:YqiA/YcfP family alpha/beta fold hydrolase [Thiomicrorhabdus chilensis]MDX1348216.1 YqiA/YcfP family alpha/beta fold hydrolase [Thiomicrorhabdus chilensis]